MGDKPGRQLASKWLKTQALLANAEIAPHIPSTHLLSYSRLRMMTHLHGTVVLKPVRGSGGRGIIKVSRTEAGYSWAYRSRAHQCDSFDDIWKAVNAERKGRRYLIQQGIDLATIGRRPVDYRVKYVKSRGRWRIRSMVGRIAARGLFVTNLCRGGRLVSGAKGIRRSLSRESVPVKKQEMRHLTKVSTGLLERRFPGVSQLGYDYGIDRNGHIWLLEVNTRPQ